ncbi:MAG: substrate-binding domain-containing protein [Victivallales bacterium]
MAVLKYWKIKEYLQAVAIRPESAVQMPTVRELMGQFNVSLATVNRALSELENEGIIVRRQGSGIVAAGNNRAVKRMDSAASRSSGNILFVYNDYPDETFWNMLHIVDCYSRQFKCGMIDCKLHPETTTRDLIDFIRAQPECRGVILYIGSDRMDSERLDALGRLPVKVALIDSMYFYEDRLPDNLYIISPDAADGAEKSAAFLLRRGHRRIGFIRNEPRSEYTDIYQKTLCAAFRRSGVELGHEQIFSAAIRSWENSLDAAVQLTENNMERIRRLELTALVYKSTPGALASLRPLLKAGFRVPEDLSILGEGERSLYRYLSPALTVLTADYKKIGCTAVDILLEKIEPRNHTILLPQELIERESVRALETDGEENKWEHQ